MATLELRNIRKAFSDKVVPVKNLSLTVEDGEFLTLLGPSGCGKSTTLRMIAGLETPTQGEILIGDRAVTQVKPGDRNIAMVFQSYALYPHMSVFDNIASPLKLKKMDMAQIRQRVGTVATSLNLDDLLNRKPGQLSGGQRQRVALGRALVRNPEVFLLDEPLSNLDALLREQVRAELKQLFAQQNTPVVYVTHDQTEAMSLSSKVAVLHQGNLQQLASPQMIYQQPANTFVASFIGSPQMNLLTLPVETGHAQLSNLKLPLPSSSSSQTSVVLGIRPEHLTLAQSGETLTGTVTLVEHLGMSHLITVKLLDENAADSGPELRALISDQCPQRGDRVSLALSPTQLHWFDAETGDRLPLPAHPS